MKIRQISLGLLAENCYFLTDDKTGETAIIDPGAESHVLEKLVGEIGVEHVKYILLTHNHWDHVGGISQLKKLVPNVKVAIHEEDVKESLSVDMILQDGDKLSLGSLEISVLHTPGHTLGGCCYIVEDVIFTGDTVFRLEVGRTDMFGGSYPSLIKSLKKIATLGSDGKDYILHPGHGESSTLSFEIQYNQYFR